MTGLILLGLAATVEVKSLTLTPEVLTGKKPLLIECAAGGPSTKVVFPIEDLSVKFSPGAREALGLRKISSHPQTVVVLTPIRHPAKGTLELTGPGIDVLMGIETRAYGGSLEVRLQLPAAMAPPPAKGDGQASQLPILPAAQGSSATARPSKSAEVATPLLVSGTPVPLPGAARPVLIPSPSPPSSPASRSSSLPPAPTGGSSTGVAVDRQHPAGPLASSSPMPEPLPALPMNKAPETLKTVADDAVLSTPQASTAGPRAPSDQPGLDLKALVAAKPEEIGRKEGLPGVKPCILVDRLNGEGGEWVWFRFRLIGGPQEHVSTVALDGHDVNAYTEEATADRKALRIVVQVSGKEVSRKSHVVLRFSSGDTYTFSVARPTLGALVKTAF